MTPSTTGCATDLTDVALDSLERELAAHPAPQSAYCADAVDSLRFHLHVHAAAMIAELKRRRFGACAVASEEVSSLLGALRKALDGWSLRLPPRDIVRHEDEERQIAELRKLVTP